MKTLKKNLVNIIIFSLIILLMASLVFFCSQFSLIFHKTQLVLDGCSFDSQQLDSFFGDSKIKKSDMTTQYRVTIQLNAKNLYDQMVNENFDGEYSDYVNTAKAKENLEWIDRYQTDFVNSLKNQGISSEVLSTHEVTQNAVTLSMSLNQIKLLQDNSQVKSITFAYQMYADSTDQISTTSTGNNIYPNDTVYKGDDMLVAVIDDGFAADHEAFSTVGDTLRFPNSESVTAKISNKTSAIFKSTKIPFGYDYGESDYDLSFSSSSHGTHVAGILAGNNGSNFKGVLSDAQLMLCKVSNSRGEMYNSYIVKAMEDCLTMGVDVVNISLGSTAGFDTYKPQDARGNFTDIYGALSKLDQDGISVVVAAGNDGITSNKDSYEKTNANTPDNSIISSPACYAEAFTVANYDSQSTKISDSSSRGPSNSLWIKPDIAGWGTSVSSAINQNRYGSMSGTSMASPNVAGVVGAVTAYIKNLDGNLSKKERQEIAINMIMSTATVAITENLPSSPRLQGAGVANIAASTTSTAYLVNVESGRAKINLGDNLHSEFVLKFNIVNLSSSQVKYKISVQTLTETLSSSGLMQEIAHSLETTNIYSVDSNGILNGDEITVYSNSTAAVQITVTLGQDAINYLKTNFSNGMYIEGFVNLSDTDSQEKKLSIPFLGFYGDWSGLDMLDKTYYDTKNNKESAYVKASALYATNGSNNKDHVVGDYQYDLPNAADVYTIKIGEEKAAISKNEFALYKLSVLRLGLLRNAAKISIKLYDQQDSATDLLSGKEGYNLVWESKCYYYRQSKSYVGGEYDLDILARDLKEGSGYKLIAELYLNYEDITPTQTFSNNFWVDSEIPNINTCNITSSNITVQLQDNRYVQAVSLVEQNSRYNSFEIIKTLPIEWSGNEQANSVKQVSLSIGTDQTEALNAGRLYVQVIDYALNVATYKLSSDGSYELIDDFETVDTEILNFKQESIILEKGNTIDLYKYINYNSSVKLNFTSSQVAVATVGTDGLLRTVGVGTCTITVTSASGKTATIKITVKESSNENASMIELRRIVDGFDIGMLTLADKEDVEKARALLNSLSTTFKSSITDLAEIERKIEQAEAKIQSLIDADAKNKASKVWITVGVISGVVIVSSLIVYIWWLKRRRF